MTPGNDAETPGIGGHRVKIKGHFDRKQFGPTCVGMPAGVAYIVVGITGTVVEVISKNTGGNPQNTMVVKQCAEPFAVAVRWDNHGTARAVMSIPGGVVLKHVLILFYNPIHLLGAKELGNHQVAKIMKELSCWSVSFIWKAPILAVMSHNTGVESWYES